VATADRIYADPSVLLKLYRHEPESRAVAVWRGTIKGPLPVTHHGRVELTNGIALAAHRGLINERACEAALAALDDDFEQGRYLLAEIPWRTVLRRAADLSREHSRNLGTRTLDVLHVASALELGSQVFVTFDHRQQSLARATGLKILAPTR
jgi:predicted nucleic acid-binding protein